MDKRVALFLATSILFMIVGNYFFFTADVNPEERINVIVARAIDGDTIESVDGKTIRLVNVNTPEKKEFGYQEAFNFMKSLENKSVEVEILGSEKYGRLLGRVYYEGYVNLQLVEEGYAHTLLVQPEEAERFHQAQEMAVSRGEGIWKRSINYGCMRAEINKKDEYVLLEHTCPGSLAGWTVKDETTRKYTFRQNIEERTILYSGEGENNESAFYWKRGNVWNDDRDSIFIRDETGNLVFYDSYGY